VPVPEDVHRLFISPLAESSHPDSAVCSYVSNLPAGLLLGPAVVQYLGPSACKYACARCATL
jgi:hypothetical protein